MTDKPRFSDVAKKQKEQGSPDIVRDVIYLLKTNKKWWLAPFIIVFALMALLILLSGTGAAPFIYTLF